MGTVHPSTSGALDTCSGLHSAERQALNTRWAAAHDPAKVTPVCHRPSVRGRAHMGQDNVRSSALAEGSRDPRDRGRQETLASGPHSAQGHVRHVPWGHCTGSGLTWDSVCRSTKPAGPRQCVPLRRQAPHMNSWESRTKQPKPAQRVSTATVHTSSQLWPTTAGRDPAQTQVLVQDVQRALGASEEWSEGGQSRVPTAFQHLGALSVYSQHRETRSFQSI